MSSDAPLNIAQVIRDDAPAPDPFKLAIRGHAAIEDAVDLTIAEAFGGTTPSELKRLPFKTRLALLVALTPMPKSFAVPIDAVAQLRHEFAHGRRTDLPEERADALCNEFRKVLVGAGNAAFDQPNAIRKLAACLIAAEHFVVTARRLAHERKETAAKAIKFRDETKKFLAEQDDQ